MKKIVLPVLLFICLASCDADGTIDESRIESAGEALQNTVETTADSVVNKVDRWTDSLDNDRRVDTLP